MVRITLLAALIFLALFFFVNTPVLLSIYAVSLAGFIIMVCLASQTEMV